MQTILHITASIRHSDESISRTLSEILVEGLLAKSNATVIHRDLSKNDLPFIDPERFAANLTPDQERTKEQKAKAAIADELITELITANTIVFGIPVYNFSVPATVKAWADLVARAGTTFRYTDTGSVGMLEGKKAYIAVASGGTPVGSEIDFMTPWLEFFLAFLGITDIEMLAADGIMGIDGEEKIEKAKVEALRMVA